MSKRYRAYVTLMGELEDTTMDFLDLYMELESDDYDEVRRFYDAVYVQPWGALAYALHASHPEYVRIEADYDIEDTTDYDRMDDYYIESIWYED